MATTQPEVWMRGPVDGVDPSLQPVVHSLLQVREELEALAASVAPEHVWQRPGGAASIGFHVRHIGGALDRLYAYARGEGLSPEQLVALKAEGVEGEALSSIVDTTLAGIKVGRSGLPSTTLGLLFHGAEHSLRHAGQAITTAKILRGYAQPVAAGV